MADGIFDDNNSILARLCQIRGKRVEKYPTTVSLSAANRRSLFHSKKYAVVR
jgi:hypothetical protein